MLLLNEKNEISYIYQILNKVNGKYYIGSTNDFNKRKSSHLSKLYKGKHNNIYLQRAWDKYGLENFEFIILKIVTRKNQFKVEQQYLNKLKPFNDNGYNIAREAIGGFNVSILKVCVICKNEYQTSSPNQKYCNECHNWQNNMYKKLEEEGKIILKGEKVEFV